MRLLKLKLKNIASLKGDHLIEFDKVIESSSLFAITGETGSGKSSILNAIAMALYGRVYKSSVTQADLVTLGEREGQIQLIFSIRGEFYLADWKGKIRKPNGEPLKKPTLERVIYKIATPSFEAEKNSDVYQAEELLNLNFDQFCKCIILNQGEFAKFLSSSFTDRKAILEKLYPGSDIENVSRFLKLELDEANSKISIITTQLETLNISPEDGDALLEKKNKINQELIFKSEWQKRYLTLQKLFESLETYFKYFHENQNRQTKLSNEIKELTHEFNLSMSETEKKQKQLEELNSENEKRAPLLQDLLKKEEQKRFLKNQITELELNLKKLSEQQAFCQKQIEDTETTEKEWSKNHQLTLNSFNFKPEHLLSFKIEIEAFIENVGKLEKLEIEKKNLELKFEEIQAKGKLLKEAISELEKQMGDSSQDILGQKLLELKAQRYSIQELSASRQVQQKTKEALLKKQGELNKEVGQCSQEQLLIQEKIKSELTILKALELSLSLHEYQLSLKKCVDHAKSEKLSHCPLCERETGTSFWDEFNLKVTDTNIQDISSQHQKLTQSINDLTNREHLLLSKNNELNLGITKNQEELMRLEEALTVVLPSLSELEEEIEKTEKRLIHLEHQQKEMKRLLEEIGLSRTQYMQTKEALARLDLELNPVSTLNTSLASKLSILDPLIETKLSLLKKDLSHLLKLTEERKQGETLLQKLSHLKENLKNIELSFNEVGVTLTKHQATHQELAQELIEKLQGKSAQEELSTLGLKIKDANSLLQNAQMTQRNLEQGLSLKRGNLSSLEQLLKDYEMEFIKTREEITRLSRLELEALNEEIHTFEEKLKHISLTLNDSVEIILASKDLVTKVLGELKTAISDLNSELGVVSEKISHWEKTQDKIKLLKLEFTSATEKVERFKRLSTILGTDELRTFALSLVEENLILQTNEELANLCQSRYEIIHQSRRGITPEFYILDKFREGGIRKVSTLSGGETFMVSLAMALALAEMTRGQAEIDTLFIDEGFGTLDQESLEDVLDMLNQIQNRGLMIGIISHIKTLTNALPVNLLLNKGQDGTSKVSLQYN